MTISNRALTDKYKLHPENWDYTFILNKCKNSQKLMLDPKDNLINSKSRNHNAIKIEIPSRNNKTLP